MPELDPSGSPVALGRLVLKTPGFSGSAEVAVPGVPGRRGSADPPPAALGAALASHGVTEFQTAVLTGVRETAGGGTRGRRGADAPVELTAPAAGTGLAQVALVEDAWGTATWHVPVAATPGPAGRGGDTVVYQLPRRVLQGAAAGDSSTRGPLGFLGRAVLRILVFPLVDDVVGRVGEHFVERWEQRYRPYRLFLATTDNLTLADPPEATAEQLTELLAAPALLLVHGTFSRARSAFAGLLDDRSGPSTFEKLSRLYEGRVLAFDHPTLHTDPIANIEWLFDHLPPGTEAQVDVVSHSRGGLVTRCLAEGVSGPGGRTVAVRRAVLAATPNAGTHLASPRHLGDLVDAYTNLLSALPDVAVLDVFEMVVAVVKELAVGVAKALPGLMAMEPDSGMLRRLNAAVESTPTYFAVASDFEPVQPGLKAWAADALADRVFGGRSNDLVVPTAGTFSANGSSLFPIADPLQLPVTTGIGHSGYFYDADVREALLRWLAEPVR